MDKTELINVNIVTVKEAGKNRVLPLPDYMFKADDAVMVLGLNADVDKLGEASRSVCLAWNIIEYR